MNVSLFLVSLGGIILLGVLGDFFFGRTRIPTPVILMFLGILLGPVTGAIHADAFRSATPYFGTIALILILFEGGLDLDLKSALTHARTALIIGCVSYALSAVAIMAGAVIFLGVDTRTALMFGLVLGGISPTIVLPVLKRMNLTKETSALFALESVLSEVLAVTCSVLAMDLLLKSGSGPVWPQIYLVAHTVLASLIVALIFGWAWNWTMPLIEKAGLSHMLTLACLFLLYAISNLVRAEPAVTILLFGLLLENGHEITSPLKRFLPSRIVSLIDFPELQQRELFGTLFSELTFLVRSFFFVLLGLIIDFKAIPLSAWIVSFLFVLISYFCRQLVVFALDRLFQQVSPSAKSLGGALIPRGLATAVVALLVVDQMPSAHLLAPIAFLVILGSNILMSAQVMFRWQTLAS